MAILKCKMCGGDISAADGAAFGTCESCGTVSTLPKASDERRANLFNRANDFRRRNEFDRAVQAYEKILDEDNADAEAHWGVVLSRYGIEYVEDSRTRERVPTCRRAQFEPILSDPDYLAALEYAPDEYTRSLYGKEARRISEIQKGILANSSKEAPYDVFICYKETADGGSRTKDSVIAQDIYDHLVKEGYRVFFSRITLEDKLGQQYEPYIFGALNSARVMLVVGTRKEHFEAVWVKNEWSRFLARKKKDPTLTLIPCYRDMDPYDMPEELGSLGLQAQDTGKVGFTQDLVRGVKKILGDRKTYYAEQAATDIVIPKIPVEKAAANVVIPKKFTDEFINDELAKVNKSIIEVEYERDHLTGNAWIEKNKLKSTYEKNRSYLETQLKQTPIQRTEGYYQTLIHLMGTATDKHRWTHLVKEFREMEGYKDTAILAKKCEGEIYDRLVYAMDKTTTEDGYKDLAGQFRAIDDYKNSAELASKCDSQAQTLKERREEQERIERERQRIERERQEEQKRVERERRAEQKRVERERQEEQMRVERERRAEQERVEGERRAEQEKRWRRREMMDKFWTFLICVASGPIAGYLVYYISMWISGNTGGPIKITKVPLGPMALGMVLWIAFLVIWLLVVKARGAEQRHYFMPTFGGLWGGGCLGFIILIGSGTFLYGNVHFAAIVIGICASALTWHLLKKG